MRAPSRPEPVGDMPELGLEYRLQERFDRALNDAVLDRGKAQRSEFPWFSGFRDEFASCCARAICATAQFGLQRDKEAVLAPAPYASHGHPVDASSAASFIGGNALPGMPQYAEVSHPTPRVAPLIVGTRLTPLVEFALNVEYPDLIGLTIHVHRSLLRRASPPSPYFPSPCARLSRAPTTMEVPPLVSSVSGHRG